MKKPRVLFLVTEDWYFCLHWLRLARAVRDAGASVLVATRVSDQGKRILDEGFALFPLRLKRRSRHPVREFAAVLELVRLYRQQKPDIVHHVAIKPILYGSVAAWLARVSVVVNAFPGLGYIFVSETWKARLFRTILSPMFQWVFTLSRSRVIFQNSEDREQLVRAGILPQAQTAVIRGVGVDVSQFKPRPDHAGPIVVLLAARMLWEKGVGDFVDAARLLKQRGVPAKCVLAGRVDTENLSHVPEMQLVSWHEEGAIEWWGYREDMPELLASTHVVVLPTYYGEGLPTILLEAASCGKSLVATQMRGCRDIVHDGVNGFLVPPKDAKALAQAIEVLVRDPALRARMGHRGRELVVREFSSERIVQETFAVYQDLLGEPWVPGSPAT